MYRAKITLRVMTASDVTQLSTLLFGEVGVSCVTQIRESCHINEGVMSYSEESYLEYRGVMSHRYRT